MLRFVMPSGTRQRSGVSLLLGSPMSILRVTRSEGDPPQGIGGALSIRGLIPHQKGPGPTQPSGEESLLRNDWVSLYLSPVAIRCDFGAFFRLFRGHSASFAASLGRKTPSRRTELWPGLEVPLDASENEDFRPDKVGEPHLIYCSPKVRRTPDMDQEHKSTTLSAVECCPSLEP